MQPAEDSSSHADHSKPSVKASVNHLYLDAPLQPTFSRPSDDVSDISLYSADNDNERRAGRPLTVSAGIRLSSRSPAPPKTWRGKIHTAWESNKGLALVTLAQLFAVMMNVTTRLLEMDGDHGKGMHPFQVCIFAQVLENCRLQARLCLKASSEGDTAWWQRVVLVYCFRTSSANFCRMTQILFARMVGTLVLSGAYQWLVSYFSSLYFLFHTFFRVVNHIAGVN